MNLVSGALAPPKPLLNGKGTNVLSPRTGDEFKELVEPYVRRGITGGVPSLFADLKALYDDVEKRSMVQTIAEAILAEQEVVSSGTFANHPVTSVPSVIVISTFRRCSDKRASNNASLVVIFPWAALCYRQRDYRQSIRAFTTSDCPHTDFARTIHGRGAGPQAIGRCIGCRGYYDRRLAP